MRRIKNLFRSFQRADWIRLGVFSCALGVAISITMGMHYGGVRSGPEVNYLITNLRTILKGLVFAVPVFAIVALLNAWCPRMCLFRADPGKRKLSDRGFFLLVWGILLVSWLPYLLTFYPGGIVGDGAEALEYAIQTNTIDGRWGIVHILLLRVFIGIGRWFSPDVNLGIFFYVIFSCCLYSATCAAVACTLRKKGLAPALTALAVFVYAFFGHYASYSMCLWKDGLFAAGITCLALLLWNEPDGEKAKRRWNLKTGGVLLFLCFWRNFISYAVLPVGILLLIFGKKPRRALAILLIIIAVFTMVIQGPVFRAIGWTGTGGTQEMLAIPIQQVAAAIHEGAVPEEAEGKVLYALLPREEWRKLYTPMLSDTIKFAIDEKALSENLGGFLKAWVQLGFRAPKAYLKAWLAETAGFWQPYGSNKGYYYDWFMGVQDLYGRGYEQKDLILQGTGATMENALMKRFGFIPSGTLVWIMLLSMVLILGRKKGRARKMLVLSPFLLPWIAILFTAPIAYSFRYVETLAVGLPVILALPFEGNEATERTARRIIAEDWLHSEFAGRVVAGLAACAVIVTLACGIYRTGWHGGKMIIETAGAEDKAKYYFTRGISVNERSFRWTVGNETEVRIPTDGKERTGEVTIHVPDTFEGKQRYRVRDGQGEVLTEGKLDGEGEIRFPVKTEGKEIAFVLETPDAKVIKDRLAWSSDDRRVGLQIDWMEVRED